MYSSEGRTKVIGTCGAQVRWATCTQQNSGTGRNGGHGVGDRTPALVQHLRGKLLGHESHRSLRGLEGLEFVLLGFPRAMLQGQSSLALQAPKSKQNAGPWEAS